MTRTTEVTHVVDFFCRLHSSVASKLDSRAAYSSSSGRLSVWMMHSEPLENINKYINKYKATKNRVRCIAKKSSNNYYFTIQMWDESEDKLKHDNINKWNEPDSVDLYLVSKTH